MVKIDECLEVSHMTLLCLSSAPPHSNWRNLLIDGMAYEPSVAVDMDARCVASEGQHDFTGKEIRFE